MESLSEAVEAVTQHAGGRPLQWREWKQQLMQGGDALSADEIAQLETILAARGDPPSMKLFLDDYADKLAQYEATRAALRPNHLALDAAPEVASVRGCAILSAEGDGPLGPQQCTQYRLTVRRPAGCRLLLQPAEPQRCLLLLLWRSSDGALLGVASAAAGGSARLDRRLEPGEYTVTAALLREPDRAPDSPQRQLFTVDPGGEVRLTEAYTAHLRELFRLWDFDASGGLSRDEFSAFNELTAGEKVQDEEWAIVGANFETRNGELTEAGFVRLHELEAEDNASEPGELWLSLTALGFGPDLAPRRVAGFQLTARCDAADAAELTCLLPERPDRPWSVEITVDAVPDQ
ncbi:EF-hand calcium-binding domain-containing protein 7-like [Amphibalanus amphitrite]|uniref:EF-hand calcium-binding domain-containing protein 7-like n=1 Tax=Amphibalanus amphitrite TaxID=1232801 RepID=UPI001C916390|nr:EF-hand calcium-binding domain-containing protein 7-like [Amphibalanus amphitrite]